MIRRPPRSTLSSSSAASDVYKRQPSARVQLGWERLNWLALVDLARSVTATTPSTGIMSTLMGSVLQAETPHSGVCPCVCVEVATVRTCRCPGVNPVSYTHLRAHETPEHLVCRLLLEKKKNK
eukprot:TRINITY_DN62199_c0_g1_i1.p1 TRINITY_DN62199_c0_g1~~TRINITY_DN62199_c0_g1_i1.p1  ORF type:complete len:123 (+),score=26.48 TRINITY_DN62199_c0_g1_i1:94-462(+)